MIVTPGGRDALPASCTLQALEQANVEHPAHPGTPSHRRGTPATRAMPAGRHHAATQISPICTRRLVIINRPLRTRIGGSRMQADLRNL
jgi:hypothetical protein